MNVNWANHIDDASKIEPQQLIDYLVKHQWIKQDFLQNLNKPIEVYQKIVEGALFQITVPMSRELRDYNSAMLRAVVEINDSEEAKHVRQITAKITKMNRENKSKEPSK
jgi:hypothetical protein